MFPPPTWSEFVLLFVIKEYSGGAWVAQSVKRPTSARSRSRGPWVRALRQALGWWLGAWSLFPILSLSLSLCPSTVHALSLSVPKINKRWKKNFFLNKKKYVYWPYLLWQVIHLTPQPILFYFSTFIYFWDRERQSMNGRGAEREGDTESETGSRLRAISPEPDAGLELTDREIVTWLKSDA